jgi:hypothetical protein
MKKNYYLLPNLVFTASDELGGLMYSQASLILGNARGSTVCAIKRSEK